MPQSYSNYLKLDSLLSLQSPLSTDDGNNESLFITVHQVSELWFKQILLELSTVQQAFETNEPHTVLDGLKRISLIFRTIIQQIDVLETIHPLAFSSFRPLLESASGFQSVQFHTIEHMLGKRPAHGNLVANKQHTLWDSFVHYLAKNNYGVPKELLQRDTTQPIIASPEIQKVIYQAYQKPCTLKLLCEELVELDEILLEWRYRHIKLVERTIGNKQGIGGSSGMEYLKKSLFIPLYPDLWAVRNAF